jgi:hypothetical protein
VLAEVRGLQQGFDSLRQDFRDHRAATKVRKIDYSAVEVTRSNSHQALLPMDAGLWSTVLP